MAAIVLGYDASPGAERALETAVELAREFGDRLVIAYGVAPPGGVGEEWREHRAASRSRRATHDRRGARERRTSGGHRRRGRARAGAAAPGAARPGRREHDARFIVVGSWGESPIRGAILGSTPHKLLHLSETPVVVVPA